VTGGLAGDKKTELVDQTKRQFHFLTAETMSNKTQRFAVLKWLLLRFICGAPILILTSCAVLIDAAIDPRNHEKIVTPPIGKPLQISKPQYPTPVSSLVDLNRYPYRGSTVAILIFDVLGEGVSAGNVALLSDRFQSEYEKTRVQNLVSSSKMKEVLDLQKFSAVCSSTECAVEAGKQLGVEYMIYGSIGKIGSLFTINVYMTSVEKGTIVASASVDFSGEIEGLLTTGIKQAVNNLLSAVIRQNEQNQNAIK
jgi:hypothetical protein